MAATCSFLKAGDARFLARNHSVIWREICGIQEAILDAIEANEYDVIVNGDTPMTSTQSIISVTVTDSGGGYNDVVATAVINANGTGGTLATVVPVVTGSTITGFTVTAGGSGYAPISVTAAPANVYALIAAQTQANYNGVGANGSFVAGLRYQAGEVITLNNDATITVNTIGAPTAVVTIDGQDETDFDGAGANGTFDGGDSLGITAYQVGDTITLNDGTVVLVDAVAGFDVTQFTIQSNSVNGIASGTTLVQVATSGSGAGFELTLDTNNETPVGPVATFTVTTAGDPFFYPATLTQASTTGIGGNFTLTPGNNNVTGSSGTGAVLTPIVVDGEITSVVVGAAGTGYLLGAPIIFTHPAGSGAVATVTAVNGSGGILAVTVTNGGSDYETAQATVTVSHPTGFGFEGTVQVTSGVVTGVAIVNGGSLYSDQVPTAVIEDPTGSGAVLAVVMDGDNVDEINVVDGGFGYTDPTVVIRPSAFGTDDEDVVYEDATATATVGVNTFGTTPSEYNDVIIGQSDDRVIEDQIQYILDYFTALGYNIRVQTNPATNNTIQWQLIW